MLYRPISTTEDYCALQCHIDTVSNLATLNLMTFTCAKCKFMLVSRKRTHSTPVTPLCLNGSALEVVPTFKYLGVLLSADLSWTQHIQNTCSKAHKIVGLLYRHYYQYSDFNTLRQLYLSLVLPHLEYAASVWSPYLLKDIAFLEDVQKFGLLQTVGLELFRAFEPVWCTIIGKSSSLPETMPFV